MQAVIETPARAQAFAQLELALYQARASGKRLVVAVIHLDWFYRINETKGMAYGSEMIRAVAERLAAGGQRAAGTSPEQGAQAAGLAADRRQKEEASSRSGSGITAVREADSQHAASHLSWGAVRGAEMLACQIGENDFLLAQELDRNQPDGGLAVEAMKYAVESACELEGVESRLTASVGASIYPNDGRTSEQLLSRAETALSRAKAQGWGKICFYSLEDTERLNRWVAIEASMRTALYERQFTISCQPIYRISDGKLRGFEALLRWNHPELGSVSPSEFLPVAEQNGWIVPIGEWVLREACQMLSSMQIYGLEQLIVTVNVSPLQLKDPAFPSMVANVLNDTGLSPACLELEIKEDKQNPSDQPLEVLTQLRAQGVRLVIDEFGTGSFSLASLKQLPINGLKISPAFTQHIDMPSAERHIVEMVIALAHKLGLEITASGVEYIEQYRLLQEWGCDYVQGFMLGKPMKPDELDLSSLRQS
ncbi:putative bifunctional diguanylate cyclase/phosphodiesterase [Paenibacillus sp. NPDC058174]|uniref:putative bifunctional diguanylate cyclase/phosphodiesterase n=1 Tax=Paenibacillus sp. NPDC058174 TaxID=3346366 RepID=UPI0036D76642